MTARQERILIVDDEAAVRRLLPEIRAGHPDIAVIMVAAVTDTNVAIQCMKQGAYDYITKPFNLDEVALSVGRALEKRRLEQENRDYQHVISHCEIGDG